MIISYYIIILLGFYNVQDSPAFEEQVIDSDIEIGYGVALGDVDGDGKPDIMVADKTKISWYRNGDWKKFVIAENVTERDNVCIAAADLDNDGKVEIAIGGQWNPAETSDSIKSGSVHYLQRPSDPTKPWKAIALPHEPTVHRMRWVKDEDGMFHLVVVPLHGRGNQDGSGVGVRIYAYEFPKDPGGEWRMRLLDSSMHLTHNFDIYSGTKRKKGIYVGGKEGIRYISPAFKNQRPGAVQMQGLNYGIGEVRVGEYKEGAFITTIEPMHGNRLTINFINEPQKRIILDEDLGEGHALGVGDFLGTGQDQVVAGWRRKNNDGKVGIRIYVPGKDYKEKWSAFWIDENTMACEDLQVMDMNNDGKPDIIAAGRATKNLKIYWNRN